jgi:hypothetical protein
MLQCRVAPSERHSRLSISGWRFGSASLTGMTFVGFEDGLGNGIAL